MTTTETKNLKKTLTIALCGAIALGLFFAVYGIWTPYSYWWDELYTVSAGSWTLEKLFTDFILVDIQPPLYLVLMHFWMKVFSTAEFATRSFSLIWCIASLTVLWRWTRQRLSLEWSLWTSALFSTSYLFIYYAQEARAYGLFIFFATLSTLSFLDVLEGQEAGESHFIRLYLSLLGLSLVHYFGLIFAGLIYLYLIVFKIRKPLDYIFMILFALLTLSWPMIHIAYGNLLSGSQDFWVQSQGIQETLSTVALALVSPISLMTYLLKSFTDFDAKWLASLFFVIGCGVLILNYLFVRKQRTKENHAYLHYAKGLLILFGLFILTMILIDTIRPLSVRRYYALLMPGYSVLLALTLALFSKRHQKISTLIGFMIIVMNLAYFVYANGFQLERLIVEDHRGVVQLIEERAPGIPVYTLKHAGNLPEVQADMARYYFSEHTRLIPIDVGEITRLRWETVVFVQHLPPDDIILDLVERYPERYEIVVPTQDMDYGAWALFIHAQ